MNVVVVSACIHLDMVVYGCITTIVQKVKKYILRAMFTENSNLSWPRAATCMHVLVKSQVKSD